MADDLDVEALLEAPYKKEEALEPRDNGAESPSGDGEERKRKHRRKKSHRSRSKSKSRSRSPRRKRRSRSRSKSRSRSPRRKRRSRSRSKSRSRSPRRKRRSHSRSGSRSPRRRRKSRSRSPHSRHRSRSRSPHRRRSRDFRPQRGSWQGRGWRRKRSHSPGAPYFTGSPPRGPGPQGGLGRQRDPDPEPPSEDRDRRTVMCMQLSAKVGPKEMEEFFQKVGQVREVKMISDRNSRRSKGIAYVEFHDEKSVPAAMLLAGQKLFGVPIIIQPTMAEKNRLAAQAQNLKKAEGPKKLYVGSLHYNINEAMLKALFEPFGNIDKIQIQRDEANISKGYGFVEFKDSESAERAMSNLNGFELAGRPMKVNHVTERDTSAMEMLDGEDTDIGVGMTPQSRAALMAKLAEGHNAGLSVPQIPQVNVPTVPAMSSCFMLSNMFDPSAENELGWENDIRDDVLEECMRYGPVLHIYVDAFSPGNVYVKCMNAQVAAAAFNTLNGRFFAGKKIVAQFIPETTYHVKFPIAMAAITPLKPSS